MEERRRFVRVPFWHSVTLASASKQLEAELLDISLKGALLRLPEPLDVNDKWQLILPLGDDAQTRLVFHLHNAHQEGLDYGFTFVQTDVESMSHLRRLLELNTGDSELIERELLQMVHPNAS